MKKPMHHRWYKRCGADFISGTMGLSLEEKGAYSLCLDLIYDHGGPIPDDARWLSGICGVSLRKWTAIKNRLVETGKIKVFDGFISNFRAEKELETPAKPQRNVAENEATLNEINDIGGTDKIREDKIRKEEKIEPKGSPKKVGSRIPDEWHVGEIEFSEALRIGLTREQIQFESEQFRDHWSAKSGSDATKLDWLATWRTWCRNSLKFQKPRFQSQISQKPKTRNQIHQEAVDRELARIIHGDEHVEFTDNVIDLAERDYRFTA